VNPPMLLSNPKIIAIRQMFEASTHAPHIEHI